MYSIPWFITVLIIALILLSLLIWVLMPVACDWHESWKDTPNRLCDCKGLMIGYYPPGVEDGTTTEFCIGIEKYSEDSSWVLPESQEITIEITDKIQFLSTNLKGSTSEERISGIGVRNMLPENLVFTINFYIYNSDSGYNQFFSGEPLDFIPTNKFISTNKNKSVIVSVMWDDSEQILKPEEWYVFPVHITFPNQLGIYMFKAEVLSNGEEYASTSFFVEVSEQASKKDVSPKSKLPENLTKTSSNEDYLLSGVIALIISILILGGVIFFIIRSKRAEQG